MSDNTDTVTDYKIFISYSNEDEEWFSSISELLMEQKVDSTIKVLCKSMQDFQAGTTIFESISSAIEECNVIMVIVTEKALKRNWLKFEFMKGLAKSQQNQQLHVVLVLVDLDVTVVQKDWHGQIYEDMVVKVTSREDWKNIFLTRMIEKIKDMKHMEPIQIALNLSVGQVWSHFFGYSKNVMPVLKDRIRTSKWYLGNKDRFPLKEFNLIPKSATAVNSLSDIHKSIEREGNVDVIIAQRGSYKDRPYKPPVYSITDQNGQRYYFVAHIPNTLSVLSESQLMKQKKTGKHLQISSGERSLQVARFSIMFNHLLNHPLNPECNNLVELIEYDDKLPGEEIAQLLLDAVKRACEETSETDSAHIDTDAQNLSVERDTICVGEDYANTVYIVHVDEDIDTAEELKSFLQNCGINVLELENPSRTNFANTTEAAKKAKWFIFILSKASLTEVQKHQCRMVLQKSVLQDEVRLIPLLNDDVEEQDLPGDMKAVLFLKKSSDDYKENVAGIIKCRSIKMEAKVSVKGVHMGMAWAYAINYLEVTKVNISEKETRKLSEKYKNAKIHYKLFLLIPKSCKEKQLGELDKDDNGQPLDPARFEQLPAEFKIENSLETNGIQRDYQLLPYMVIDDNKQEHIVFAEFVNPVKCLQEMMDRDIRALSGLTTQVFDDEVDKFQALLKDIIKSQGLDKKFVVVFYDDLGKDLIDVLLDLLKE